MNRINQVRTEVKEFPDGDNGLLKRDNGAQQYRGLKREGSMARAGRGRENLKEDEGMEENFLACRQDLLINPKPMFFEPDCQITLYLHFLSCLQGFQELHSQIS